MGGFQFQKPIRQKLLSKQQRGPFPNYVEKQGSAIPAIGPVSSAPLVPLAEAAQGAFPTNLPTAQPEHHLALNTTFCLKSSQTFMYWFTSGVTNSQALILQVTAFKSTTILMRDASGSHVSSSTMCKWRVTILLSCWESIEHTHTHTHTEQQQKETNSEPRRKTKTSTKSYLASVSHSSRESKMSYCKTAL